ncbi:MAG: LysR substrate-binding domain-containing protein [Thiotrichales bacterium]
MDRFEALRVFVRVVEQGGVSAAADRLHIAKSAVSRRIAELEERLGAQLFRRSTRKFNLTDSGWGLYERAVRILADLEEAEAAVSQAHKTLRGRLRVAVPISFGLHHLGPAIVEFAQTHPEVEFDLDFSDRQMDLLQDGFDLAIRIAQLEDSSLIARRLTPIRLVVCASPGYLEQYGRPQHPDELANHPGLVYTNVPNPEVVTWFDARGRARGVRVPARLRADNGEFLTQAALAGAGVLIAPTFIVHREIDERRLLPLLTDVQWPQLAAYAVYPQTRHLSRRVRAFVDFLVARFAGCPAWDRCLNADDAHATGGGA